VNLAENLVPGSTPDARSIDVISFPEDDPHVNPIGAKGIGEVGIVGVAPGHRQRRLSRHRQTGTRSSDQPI